MLTKNEAQSLAAATNALRPDWSVAQLMGVIADERLRVRRTFRDVAIALTALAVDPNTRQPTRIFEHGHWWEMLAPTKPVVHYRVIEDDDCAVCFRPRTVHSRLSTVDGHDYEPQHSRSTSATANDEQRVALDAASVAAKLAKSAAREPAPTPTRRTASEVLADHKENA